MKREKKLLLLTGILVICVAGTVLISRMNFEEKMTGTETAVIDLDSADITGLSWDYEGETVEFVSEDGEWAYVSDEKMQVDQELLNEIAENLSHISSDKKVEEVQSLGVYGLSDPSYNITVTTEDIVYELAVGDETFSDGEVYISNGDGYVYLTDAALIDTISYSLLDCVQKEEIPEMESISEITVENETASDLIYKESSGYCYSDAYTYYMKDGDTYRNLDNENTETTFTSLSEFSWEACADYYAEDSELSSYGLDDPAASVSITYVPAEDGDSEDKSADETEDNAVSAQTFSYEVGTADGAYYAKLKDSQIVYSISGEVYQTAVDVSYDNLKPDEVILLDWDTVDRVELELDGNVYTVEVEKGEDGEYQYTFHDGEIDFAEVPQLLSEISVVEESDEEDTPDEEPALSNNKSELKITFYRNTEEYSKVELAFYQYDGSWCISVLDGEEVNYTERSAVVDLKEAVNTAILNSSSDEQS